MEHRCSTCNVEKSLSEFYTNPNGNPRSPCKPCLAKYSSARRLKDPVKFREERKTTLRRYDLMTKYGLTLEEYERLTAEQEGGCAVCGQNPNGHSLHVDHDHATGAVRALLCSNCNTAMGLVGDDPERLRALVNYLESFLEQD